MNDELILTYLKSTGLDARNIKEYRPHPDADKVFVEYYTVKKGKAATDTQIVGLWDIAVFLFKQQKKTGDQVSNIGYSDAHLASDFR